MLFILTISLLHFDLSKWPKIFCHSSRQLNSIPREYYTTRTLSTVCTYVILYTDVSQGVAVAIRRLVLRERERLHVEQLALRRQRQRPAHSNR